MGNCCCDRKDDRVFPHSAICKDPPPARFSAKEASWGPDELSDERNYAGLGLSTTPSESTLGKPAFVELLEGLERWEELRPEEWVETRTWIGTIQHYSARTALALVLDLQGTEFGRSAKTRLAYYLAMRRYSTIATLLSGLNSPIRCIKHSFASLLEVILDQFQGLVVSLVHVLLAQGILETVERGLKRQEEPEFQLCLTCILGKMSRKNEYVQGVLALPSAYSVMRLVVGLLEKIQEAEMLVRLAESLHFMIYCYDGRPSTRLLASLRACGLSMALSRARSHLSSDPSLADSLLQELQLLA